MFVKGVELTRQRTGKYCTEYHCDKSFPLCCICISRDCCDSSSKWCHISAGEHVCSICYNRILSFFSYEKRCSEVCDWKRLWLKQSYENSTPNDFIVDKLMPVWCVCTLCGKWRQVNRDLRLTPNEIQNLKCRRLITHSIDPCKVPEDSRIEFIKTQPQSFFESLKYQPLLKTIPRLDVYNGSSLDVLGVCPTATLIDFGLDECQDFMMKFNPYLKRSKFKMAAGSIDPLCLAIWERDMFPAFSDNLRNIFIGLRNLILLLWAADPKRVVDEALLNKFVNIHGIVRVALLVNTVPDLIRVYSGMGYINYGFLPSTVQIFDGNEKKNIVIVGATIAGLAAASHLASLGARVTVVDSNSPASNNAPRSLELFDIIREVHGSINHPLTVAAYQLGICMRDISNEFTIFDRGGCPISAEIDEYFQNFVYGFVNYVMEESEKIRNSEVLLDRSLQDLYFTYHEKMLDDRYLDSLDVQQVYIAELEYRLFGGVSLSEVTTKFQLNPVGRGSSNFDMREYSGDNVEPIDSWAPLREALVSRIDIAYSSAVRTVSKVGDKYIVETSQGVLEADKLILALDPWDVAKMDLAPGMLDGATGLPDVVAKADGATLFVLRMLFPADMAFWRGVEGEPRHTFALVPSTDEERGFCHLFRETDDGRGGVLLETSIFGGASRVYRDLSDEQIVTRAMHKLAPLSAGRDVSWQPQRYEVHRVHCPLLACTDLALCYARIGVADSFSTDVYMSKGGPLSGPRSVSDEYCRGMEIATSLVRDLL